MSKLFGRQVDVMPQMVVIAVSLKEPKMLWETVSFFVFTWMAPVSTHSFKLPREMSAKISKDNKQKGSSNCLQKDQRVKMKHLEVSWSFSWMYSGKDAFVVLWETLHNFQSFNSFWSFGSSVYLQKPWYQEVHSCFSDNFTNLDQWLKTQEDDEYSFALHKVT